MTHQTFRDLAALADGSLPSQRRRALRRRISGSPDLVAALEQQMLAVHLVRALVTPASPALRAWVEDAIRNTRCRRPDAGR